MLTIEQLTQFLEVNGTNFEIINHTTPILTVKDAKSYFDTRKAAPVFIMQTEKGLIALITNLASKKLDFNRIREALGFQKFKMADPKIFITERDMSREQFLLSDTICQLG